MVQIRGVKKRKKKKKKRQTEERPKIKSVGATESGEGMGTKP